MVLMRNTTRRSYYGLLLVATAWLLQLAHYQPVVEAFAASSSNAASPTTLRPFTNDAVVLGRPYHHVETRSSLASAMTRRFPQQSSSISLHSMAAPTFISIMSAPTGLFQKIFGAFATLSLSFVRELQNMSTAQKAVTTVLFTVGFLLGRTKPFWKRFTNVADIPASYFGPTAPVLTGRAVSVSDGDTIRFLHTPTPLHPTQIRKSRQEKVSTTALPIRLCTIDTPETAKFGKPGQPFGVQAKETLKALLENKRVKIRMLQRDQYSRAVCQVFVRNGMLLLNNKKIFADEHMLSAGMAEVYQGGGAVYGPLGLDGYLELEKAAQDEKLGIWSQGERESAAEYKKRTK